MILTPLAARIMNKVDARWTASLALAAIVICVALPGSSASRVSSGTGHLAGVDEVAGWLTPNPGGVGPMTRAMLIKNTFEAEVRRRPPSI